MLFGLLLEWYAVKVILLEESGFRFPLTVPWREAGIIAALAVTTATLAALAAGAAGGAAAHRRCHCV